MNNGWNSCGCSTVYTDAWGRPINGPGTGSDGNPVAQCAPDWGLLALAGVAAIAGLLIAQHVK